MLNLLDLPSELKLAITSHIPRSNDKFHLLLVNRELYHMIIPQLYKHIHLGQTENPSNTDGFTRTYADSCWDTVRLRRLTSVLENRHATHKPPVESLSLELSSNTLSISFGHSNITLFLPGLKSLCLNSKRLARQKWKEEPYYLSPANIRDSLRGVHQTLESLIIDLDQDPLFRDGTRIRTFRYFKALKHLSIQSHILLPEFENYLGNIDRDYNLYGDNETMLVTCFPETLQRLQISCWTDRDNSIEAHWDFVIALLLRKMMNDLDLVPALQKVTVYCPYYHRGGRDMDIDDMPDLRRCAAGGQWQAIGNILMEAAWKEHRDVSVKVVQGSPEGSRAWGETAIEPSEYGRVNDVSSLCRPIFSSSFSRSSGSGANS